MDYPKKLKQIHNKLTIIAANIPRPELKLIKPINLLLNIISFNFIILNQTDKM